VAETAYFTRKTQGANLGFVLQLVLLFLARTDANTPPMAKMTDNNGQS